MPPEPRVSLRPQPGRSLRKLLARVACTGKGVCSPSSLKRPLPSKPLVLPTPSSLTWSLTYFSSDAPTAEVNCRPWGSCGASPRHQMFTWEDGITRAAKFSPFPECQPGPKGKCSLPPLPSRMTLSVTRDNLPSPSPPPPASPGKKVIQDTNGHVHTQILVCDQHP